ncbi:protein of unknown function [Rhodoferax sp. OV413]|uniref:DUF4149 domain-containing protein n=1 Tax=Rhodoferax sp. OV413 TaxID=1855285 RepID=UPI00088F371B|nr:DUF4149 domain-containing protein [Rhodoferax sp. OV413]SDP09654.1 protein of unknown function [Rhodoferax sp. OV413]
MRQRLPIGLAALWWGSLTTLGFMVVPLLFMLLPTPALAGSTAAKLFTAQTWLSMGCTLLLLLISRSNAALAQVEHAPIATIFIAFGLFAAVLVEFAVSPHIVARENLKLWHGLGTGLYVLQWLAAGATLWKVSAPRG